ncbi:MAG: hypothetical protein K2Y18_09455 [Alphaproteobacteria bacterium]|nr:hypothetical protein [Alphaproteobacteria bacterium]
MSKLNTSAVLFGGLLISINAAIASPWDPGGTRDEPLYSDPIGTTTIDGTGSIHVDGQSANNIDGNSTINKDGSNPEVLPRGKDE